MRREQFYSKYNHLGVDQRELERKYQAYLREQEEMMMHMQYVQSMNEAAQSSSSAGTATAGGGGGQVLPVAQVEIGQSAFILFTEAEGENYKVLTLDSTSGEISNVVDIGVSSTEADYYYKEILAGRGIMLVGQYGNGSLWFCFIDAAGNLMGETTVVETYDYAWNSRSNNGLSIAMGYRLTLGQGSEYYRVHSFFGEQVWVQDFPIGSSNQDYPYYYYFDNSNGGDGSFDVYWYDDNGLQMRYIQTDGTSTVINDVETPSPYYDYNTNVADAGDSIFIIYWNDDTDNAAFLRAWDTKSGNYQDFDFGPYNITDYDIFQQYGKNKNIVLMYNNDDNTIPWLVVIYDGDTKSYSHLQVDRVTFPNWNYNDLRSFQNFQNYTSGSVKGLDVAALWFRDNGSFDGTMWQYNEFLFVWKNGTGPLQTYDATAPTTSFGFYYPEYAQGDCFTTFCKTSTSDYLQLVTLSDSGAVFTELPSLYADVSDYFGVISMESNVGLTYYDNSREGDIQYFGVWDPGNQVFFGENLWKTTNNGWNTQAGVFVISDYDSGNTTFWDAYGIQDWFTYNSAVDDTSTPYGNFNGSGFNGDYITADYKPSMQLSGTKLYFMTNGDVILQSRAHGLQAAPGEPLSWDYRYITPSYIYYIFQDGNYYVSVYDTAWNLVVDAADLGFSNWGDVYGVCAGNERFSVQVNGVDDEVIFNLVTPNGLVQKTITRYSNDAQIINDWTWWD